MRKTSLILIITNDKNAYLKQYNVRKTLGGQLVLELVKRKGSINQLNLNTEESFIGIIMKKNYSNYKNKVKMQIGGAMQEIAQEQSVVVTLNDKDLETYEPYRIMFFCNNVFLEKINSKKSVDVLEDEIIIEISNGYHKDIFSLRKTKNSSFINLEKIQLEKNPLYANIQNVEWIDKNTSCNKSVCIFDREWAYKMLRELLKIKNYDTIIYPTLKGKWVKEKNSKLKVLPKDAYSKELNERKETREFWREYLQNIIEIKVEYSEENSEGKIIRKKYKK